MLLIERCAFLDTLSEIRVGNIVTTECYRIDITCLDIFFCFIGIVATRRDDGLIERITDTLTELIAIRRTTCPIWL